MTSFVVAPSPQTISTGVNNILANGNAISNLPTTSIVINGISFNVSSTSVSTSNTVSTSTSTSPSYANTSLTIGLTVGLVVGLVGGFILVLGIIFGYRKYNKGRKHRLLMNDSNDEDVVDKFDVQKDDGMINSSLRQGNTIVPLKTKTPTRPMPSSVSTLPVLGNQVNSTPTGTEIPRAPSAAMSITMLDFMDSNKTQHSIPSLPKVELIKFD